MGVVMMIIGCIGLVGGSALGAHLGVKKNGEFNENFCILWMIGMLCIWMSWVSLTVSSSYFTY